METQTGRRLSASGRSDDRVRTNPPRQRGPRHSQRRSRGIGQPAGPPLPRPAVAGSSPAATAGAGRSVALERDGSPATRLSQRHRWVHGEWAGVRDRARRGSGNSDALGKCHGQPGFRDRRFRLGLGLYLGGKQPGEPSHTICQRSSHRRNLGSPFCQGRRGWPGLVSYSGTIAPQPREWTLRNPPRTRCVALYPGGPRDHARPERVRGRKRSGQVRGAESLEPERAPPQTQCVRLQRVDSRPATAGGGISRRQRARRGERRDPRAKPLQPGIRRKSRVRLRQRAFQLRHGRSALLPRSQWILHESRCTEQPGASRSVRRRPRSLCGVSSQGGPRPRRKPPPRLPAGSGPRPGSCAGARHAPSQCGRGRPGARHRPAILE